MYTKLAQTNFFVSCTAKTKFTQAELCHIHCNRLHFVAGSIPTGGKYFAEINLPFTMKQYKNDNIANFVYYEKTRLKLVAAVI